MTHRLARTLQETTLSRRTLLSGVSGTAGMLALGGFNAKTSAAVVATTGFGVCIHSTFRTSVYANDDRVFASVNRLGAKYIRDFMLERGVNGQFDQTALWQHYRDAGVRVHATVGAYGRSFDQTAAAAQLVRVSDCLVDVAGYNEPEYIRNVGPIPRSTWLPPTAAHQRWLFKTIKSNPKTRHIKVGLGSLRGQNTNLAADQAALMEACRGSFDFVNLHIYPGGALDVPTFMDKRFALAKGFPIVVSEMGESSASRGEVHQGQVCEDAVNHVNSRGHRGFLYELLDDVDPGVDLESNFGMLEADFTDKPAAVALRTLA